MDGPQALWNRWTRACGKDGRCGWMSWCSEPENTGNPALNANKTPQHAWTSMNGILTDT